MTRHGQTSLMTDATLWRPTGSRAPSGGKAPNAAAIPVRIGRKRRIIVPKIQPICHAIITRTGEPDTRLLHQKAKSP